jgi:predicted nucleic acid-binding protein
MILLDTNVVSETMRAAPDPRVVAWLDAQVAETLYLSTVSLAELLLGVALLPDGRRKGELGDLLAGQVTTIFGSRLLSFDRAAAEVFAVTMSRARAGGTAIGFADGQIAAIARAHGLQVASRDIVPFRAAGLVVINPWQ